MNIASAEPLIIRGHAEPRVFGGRVFKRHLTVRDIVWARNTVFLYQPGRAGNPMMPSMTGEQFLGYAKNGDHLVNAHVCDHIEDNPDLFFEEWRTPVGSCPGVHGTHRKVHFCGTIFKDERGGDAIKTLYWDFEEQKLAAIFTSLRGRFFHGDFVASPYAF